MFKLSLTLFAALLFASLSQASLASDDPVMNDWRSKATLEEKVEKVVKVIPSASDVMFQMGDRYKNLYWAAKQGKWAFAEYQVEEMQSLIKKLMITRPKRARTAGEFLEAGFSRFSGAFAQQDWPQFQKAFAHMRDECMICHAKNDHSFIALKKTPPKGSSPVLD